MPRNFLNDPLTHILIHIPTEEHFDILTFEWAVQVQVSGLSLAFKNKRKK